MTKEAIRINGENFLTRQDVMDLFKISTVTLSKWTKKGIIRHHSFGKNVYFIEAEICEDLKNSGSKVRKSHKEIS